MLNNSQLLFIDGSEPDGVDMRPATEITATRIGLGTYVASGPSVPTDLVITKTGITIKQATSEDLLHAGGGTTKLKTINNTSLLGEGNIDVSATIPIASDTVLGGIKVGAGLAIDEGVVSVDAGSVEAGSVQWENVKGKPSAFATNLANISDLQANWDAILKAAPTAFVEAIPTGEIEALFE